MAELVEVVIFGDCMGEEGETFLRGERRAVSQQVYRQLVASGRVCSSDEASEAAEAELASRNPDQASEPAPPSEPFQASEKKTKGKSE